MAKMMKKVSIQLISGSAKEKAIKHVLNVLDFDNSLCKFLKSHIDFNIGSVFSVVPTDLNVDDIVDFIKDGAHGGTSDGKSWTGVTPDGQVGINDGSGNWEPQGHWTDLK